MSRDTVTGCLSDRWPGHALTESKGLQQRQWVAEVQRILVMALLAKLHDKIIAQLVAVVVPVN